MKASQIKCGSCGTVAAMVSEIGLALPPPSAQNESCSACEQVRPFYDAMKSADELYASLSTRRDTYGPKQSAFFDVKRTHREFSNLLAKVEDSTRTPDEELTEGQPASNIEAQSGQEDDEPYSAKRPRSKSSNSLLDAPASSSDGLTNTGALQKPKRLKFSKSVEFREDYRPCDSYARSNLQYVRGRYAPPDGREHLDTSGSDKSFLKFTGMKKVGKNWVDVWKDEDVMSAQTNDAGIAEAERKEPTSENQEDPTEPEAPSDDRAQRFAKSSITPDGMISSKDGEVMHECAAKSLSDLHTSSNTMLQPTQAVRVPTEAIGKTGLDHDQSYVPAKRSGTSLSQPQLDVISVCEETTLHETSAQGLLISAPITDGMEGSRDATKHKVEERFPIRTGRTELERFHQHGEKSDLKDLVPHEHRSGVDLDTSDSGSYRPAVGKQNSTRGIVGHALAPGRSPQSREPSLDHTTAIAADGHSSWTNRQAAPEDPICKQDALSSQGNRPTIDEATTNALVNATTPFTGQQDSVSPQKEDT